MIDDKITFKCHINNVVTWLFCQLYDSDLVLPQHVKHKLVYVLIMPHIIYCIEVYCGTTKNNMKRIMMAINRTIRY